MSSNSKDAERELDGQYDDGADGDNLPTYEDLAERQGPNSRFGRWREWVEKRAAERYADLDAEDRQRRRERGWGNDMFEEQATSTSRDENTTPIPDPSRLSISTPPAPAPPIYTEFAAPTSAPRASPGTIIEPAHLSLYNFGSRFLPHAKAPIHALLPIMHDRFLLIGTQDGMSMIDTAPSTIDENSNLVEGIHGAIQRDLWKGESVYQLSLLEYNDTPNGVPQGVVMALVGSEQSDSPDKEKEFRSVRMYNLSSLASLAIWASQQRTNQPVDLQPPTRGNPANTLKKHRPRTSMTLTRNFKNLMAESSAQLPGPCGINEPSSPPNPPSKSSSVDSAQTQWDVVDDLPIRWASDYVSLATESSKLGGISVICYEIWQEAPSGQLSQTKLAIATKNHIFLYGTPKGERAFKFIKDFYTPFAPRELKFVHQQQDRPNVTVPAPGHRRGLSAPVSLDTVDQLCLFVRYEKKAGLIRLSDSAVSEVELNDEPSSQLLEPIASPSRSSSMRKSLSFSESIGSSTKEKVRWLSPSQLYVPGNGSVTAGYLYFLTKGLSTHILPSPLPNPLNSKRPFKVVTWMVQPTAVLSKVLNLGIGQQPLLQLIALGSEGVEVQEFTFSFLSKGKGKMQGEPLLRAHHDIGPTGILGFGGSWHRDKQLSYSSPSIPYHNQGGIYGWNMRGHQDWRIVWLGGNQENAQEAQSPVSLSSF